MSYLIQFNGFSPNTFTNNTSNCRPYLWKLIILLTLSSFIISAVSIADDSVILEAMTVEDTRVNEFNQPGELHLNTSNGTGSRLGLTPFETPASVDIIDKTNIEKIGAQSIGDALITLPGVTVGNSPAAPSSFSIRGFTRSQITLLRDGIWLGPANMVSRPQKCL